MKLVAMCIGWSLLALLGGCSGTPSGRHGAHAGERHTHVHCHGRSEDSCHSHRHGAGHH